VNRWGWTFATILWVIASASTLTRRADAQLVVGKAGADVGLERVHYMLVREGKRTVLYLHVAVKSRDGFSLVYPMMSSSKGKARVATPAEEAMLSRLDDLAAPRLVEYWEQDPCEFHTGGPDDGVPERNVPPGSEPKAPPTRAAKAELGTAIGLEKQIAELEERGFTLPEGAEPLLGQYAGPWVVAYAAAGESSLTLRAVVEGDALQIPARLLSLDETAPTIVVDVVGRSRFEAANRPNIAAPSNTNVKLAVKGSTEVFHDAVLAKLFESAPGGVVTEYAWSATSCAPCPGPPLDAEDMRELGVTAPGAHEVMIFTEGNITVKPDGPPALRKALMDCYAKALSSGPVAGEVTVDVVVDKGRVRAPKASGPEGTPQALLDCAAQSVKATAFNGKNDKGEVRVQFLPVSRKYVSDLVVTRLRARPSADEDIALRAGSPIAGGAEVGPTGGPKVGAYAAPKANHFQSRYTVRHPWDGGKPSCQNPSPGKWGAPPRGVTPKPPAGAGLTDPSEVALNDLVRDELASVEKLTMRFPPRDPAPVQPATIPPPASVASAAPSAEPSASRPEQPAPTKAPDDGPDNPLVGFLALGVCVVALYLSQRAQS
jgi:hypothetical protein